MRTKFCTESDNCLYALYLIFKLHFCLNNFADSIICISLYGLANIVSYVPGRLLLTDYFISVSYTHLTLPTNREV